MPAIIGVREEMRAIQRELVLRELARKRLEHFIRYRFVAEKRKLDWNWHLSYLCELLEAVWQRQLPRLLVNMPPRSLKSEVVSQCWQAWMIGKDNSRRSSMVSASYSATLAERDSRVTRDIVRSAWYATLFETPRMAKDTEAWWGTVGGADRIAAGVAGSILGTGGDHLLIDDPLKSTDANSEVVREKGNSWYGEVFRSRLNDQKTGTITLIAQRLHERDMCGHLLALQKNPEADQFYHVELPAENIAGKPKLYHYGAFKYLRRADELLHAERLGRKEIAALKASMKINFDGQYNQRPTKMAGGRLRPALLLHHQASPAQIIKDYGLIVDIYGDLATKAPETEKDDPDFTVWEVWARDQLQRKWLLHLWRKQCSMDEAARALIDLRRVWKPRFVKAEKIGLQHAFRSVLLSVCRLKRISVFPILDLSAAADPIQKVQPFESALNAGQVCVPEGATWLPDFEAELRAWPRGGHDDQIVAAGYACNDLDNVPEGEVPHAHPDIDPSMITGEMLARAAERARAARRQMDGDFGPVPDED